MTQDPFDRYTSLMSYPSELFFNEKFRIDLDWKNQFKLRLGTLTPLNRYQLSNSLKDLSQESIRNRFMGSKKEFSETELEYLTNLDGWNHYAIGIEERNEPCRGVAIARLVRSSADPLEAEIAITIIDHYQKVGLGSLLMKMIGLAAAERKLERLSFTFMPQNEAIIKLIHRLGPTYPVGHPDMDYVQLKMDIKDIDLEQIQKDVETKVPGLKNYLGLMTRSFKSC
jgi:GNAT superfamily N-acetyltransferase